MYDFRSTKDSIKEILSQLNEKDKNWKWKATFYKNKICVWWSYLQQVDTKDSHFTITLGSSNDTVIAQDITGECVNTEIIGMNGDFFKCTILCLKSLFSFASNCY